jgi:hypothetical protein
MPELTITLLSRTQSRLHHMYHGQPYARVDLNPFFPSTKCYSGIDSSLFISRIFLLGFLNPEKSMVFFKTSGFWPRVRARAVRAPVFLGSLKCQTGRCAPPRPAQLRCFIFTPQNFPSGPNSGRQGCVYLSIGLSCTLPRSAAPNELHCTLLSYAVPLRYATLN